jgi:hypothetical protein
MATATGGCCSQNFLKNIIWSRNVVAPARGVPQSKIDSKLCPKNNKRFNNKSVETVNLVKT